MLNQRLWLAIFLAFTNLPVAVAEEPTDSTPTYAEIVAADEPVLYWSFDGATAETIAPHTASSLKLAPPAKSQGKVKFAPSGPAAARFPLFAKTNDALELVGAGGRIVLTDPGANSPLDYDRGDSLTLEAWVNCTKLGEGQQVYIIGKGRTKNAGVATENQNYALRLTGQNGQAAVSFLFRSADNRANERNDFHRWNSQTGFAISSGWHYVAVTYTFGQAKSIRGYIDGQPVDGTWDYGGATDEAPVVDNDELWIGSSMGGNPGSSFVGALDEIAIYRTALDAKRIAARWSAIAPKSYVTDEKLLPAEGFVVELFEGVPDKTSWEFPFPEPSEQYFESALALLEVPHKYTSHGVRGDRSNPFVLRMSGRWRFAAGEQQLLLRSRGAARFYVDGKLVVENKFSSRGGDGHNEVYPVDVQIVPDIRVLPIGDREELVSFQGTGQPQRVTLEIFCGGRGRRPEIGETLLAVIEPSGVPLVPRLKESVSLVAINAPAPASALRWEAFAAERTAHYAAFNQQRRRAASAEFAKYWEERHATARQQLAASPPPALPAVKDKAHVQNAIDLFINTRLEVSNVQPLPLVDDTAFLRRVALDLTGRVPPPELLHGKQSRAQVIDQLLASPEWADHWTSYWQDVLAENPNIINPTLN
ncbi:MAG TPA: LamG-like jellyroll fold domain-containing protein, partial [Pirellulaceae bacterium]|nr:LamG-like jellyroll fold domain-containing protein [Pirellulaceae bacterium]